MENTRRRRRAAAVLLLLTAGLAPARASERDPMLLIDEAGLKVRMHFQAGGTGAITFEDAYLGLRTTAGTGPFFDISFGPRPFKAGTGMTGAANAP